MKAENKIKVNNIDVMEFDKSPCVQSSVYKSFSLDNIEEEKSCNDFPADQLNQSKSGVLKSIKMESLRYLDPSANSKRVVRYDNNTPKNSLNIVVSLNQQNSHRSDSKTIKKYVTRAKSRKNSNYDIGGLVDVKNKKTIIDGTNKNRLNNNNSVKYGRYLTYSMMPRGISNSNLSRYMKKSQDSRGVSD